MKKPLDVTEEHRRLGALRYAQSCLDVAMAMRSDASGKRTFGKSGLGHMVEDSGGMDYRPSFYVYLPLGHYWNHEKDALEFAAEFQRRVNPVLQAWREELSAEAKQILASMGDPSGE